MSENLENRISSTQAKDAIFKAHSISSSASEIDGSVNNGILSPLQYSNFNGVDSFVNLDTNYVLANDGDYFEFICKWDNLLTSPNTTLGLFGKNDGSNNNTIGINGTPLNLYIRGETSTWMIFNIAEVFRACLFNKFRLDVIGINLRLTLNNVVISTIPLASPITINNIGKAYGVNFVSATIQSLKIHTSIADLLITDLFADTRFIKNNIGVNTFYKSNLSYMFDGLNNFVVYKKQANYKYIAYVFARKIDVSKNADNWRINIIALVDENFIVNRYITNGGEIETAFRPKEGATLASDHMGGEYHGDEMLTNFIAMIDGVKISLLSKSAGVCKKIEFIQNSNLYCPAGLSYSGTNVADVVKRWVFTDANKNKLLNKVKFNRDMTLEDAYMFMMPIKRNDALGQITDTFITSPLYTEINVINSGHSNPFYIGTNFGGSASIWSNVSGLSSEVNVIKGWNIYPTCQFNVSPDTIFNKLYCNFLKTQNVLTNEVIDAEIEFDICSK